MPIAISGSELLLNVIVTIISMSGKGNSYDNTAVESFFRSLKAELIWRMKWQVREQAEKALFGYINRFYNPKRPPSYLGNMN